MYLLFQANLAESGKAVLNNWLLSGWLLLWSRKWGAFWLFRSCGHSSTFAMYTATSQLFWPNKLLIKLASHDQNLTKALNVVSPRIASYRERDMSFYEKKNRFTRLASWEPCVYSITRLRRFLSVQGKKRLRTYSLVSFSLCRKCRCLTMIFVKSVEILQTFTIKAYLI